MRLHFSRVEAAVVRRKDFAQAIVVWCILRALYLIREEDFAIRILEGHFATLRRRQSSEWDAVRLGLQALVPTPSENQPRNAVWAPMPLLVDRPDSNDIMEFRLRSNLQHSAHYHLPLSQNTREHNACRTL